LNLDSNVGTFRKAIVEEIEVLYNSRVKRP
jgi:hypothetical protein